MHIHLDLVGGLSGDMFISVMLDCFPDQTPLLQQVMVDAGFCNLVHLVSEEKNDGVLTGTHFTVHPDKDAESHHHRHYSEIRSVLSESGFDDATCEAALGIFRIIAEAEASIHGKEVDAVAFHEIGAWDSIADIVCAAHLITQTGVTGWSVSSIPLGRGQVKTAHGMLPIPAPATSLILKGFKFHDDGMEGERITPTGAAILKYLNPDHGTPGGVVLKHTGTGFGARRFPGISNVVRALVFVSESTDSWITDQVLQLEFEVDDQTPEALAVALQRIRMEEGVLDVIQMPYLGKKGRQGTCVRVLAAVDMETPVTETCFRETTTLGIRRQRVDRAILRREESVVNHDGRNFRVKTADRPGGRTVKVEMDDLQTVSITHQEDVRRQAEIQALDQSND